MRELTPCPSCARHVRDARCPFCGAPTEGARPGPVRPVSRRALTRAAVFAGAALWAGCGGPEIEYEVASDTGGGEVQLESSGFAHAVDDGSGDRRATDDDARRRDEERRRQEHEMLEAQRRMQEQQERYRYHHRECTPEGICPPYGAPAIDTLV